MTPGRVGRTPSSRVAQALGAVVGLVVTLGACSGPTGASPGPDGEAVRPCPQGAPALSADDLEAAARDDGPLLHATLWARRHPAGQVCVSLERGHADVGAEVVEAEVTASGGGQTLATRGGDISDLTPLRLDAADCVVLTATVVLRGESGLHEHRATSRVGRDCPR